MVEQQVVQAARPSGLGGPVGAVRQQHRYLDTENRYRTARDLVPVDEFGRLVGVPFRCRRCVGLRWVSTSRWRPGSPPPMCEVHERPMVQASLRRQSWVSVREAWDASERKLRPVWALPGLVAGGAGVDAAGVPGVAALVAAPLVGEVARRAARRFRVSQAVQAGRLDPADVQAHKRRRAAIDRAARKVGYAAGGSAGWLALPAWLGVDPGTVAGRVVWAAAAAVWLPAAATWWWMDRNREQPRVVEEAAAPVEAEPDVDPAEAEVRRIWTTVLAVRQGDTIGRNSRGEPLLAAKDGRLFGCRLTGWRPVRGGWRAVIAGPAGVYEADDFMRARGKVASAFSVSKGMVGLVPDAEDENRCEIVVQKASVIREVVRWSGPDSIDVQTGQAPYLRYVDGSYGKYELWRPGWGCAHEMYVGTTGSGKSQALQMAFTIGRWAQHEGRGLVADFLIDPQQGQSFSAFIDDLAAPVAQTADEALMLVRAFRREMLRRNAYLSRKQWTDGKGRQRRAVTWWNPLTDGPILCLTVDEAHEYLGIREFAALVTAGARMYRKCGMRIRVSTHTPLLSDLGGSMALRDMLTGGAVWCGRTANSLTAATAFNGKMLADPRFIPPVEGAAYYLSAVETRGMLARTMWEPDFYDWVRDDSGAPIGWPGVVPAETLAAFGEEYAAWVRSAEAGEGALWTPSAPEPVQAEQADDYLIGVVLWALQTAEEPLDMNGMDAALRTAGVEASTLAVRQALAVLRGRGQAVKSGNRHELDPRVRAEFERQCAEQLPPGDADEDAA